MAVAPGAGAVEEAAAVAGPWGPDGHGGLDRFGVFGDEAMIACGAGRDHGGHPDAEPVLGVILGVIPDSARRHIPR